MKGKPFRDRDNQALHDKRMNESVRVAISRKNIEFILAHQHDSREELARSLPTAMQKRAGAYSCAI